MGGRGPLTCDPFPDAGRGTDRAAFRAARAVVGLIRQTGAGVGDRLPPESELRARVGCGRATLREALRYLEVQGVLALRRGRGGGPVVALPDEDAFVRQVELVLLWAGASVGSVAETRLAVEPVSAELCAVRRSDDDLVELELSVEALRHAGPRETVVAARGFHDLVARTSGNVLLTCLGRSFDGLLDVTDLGAGYVVEAGPTLLAAHERILAAIRDGDGPRARAAMTAHLSPYADYAGRHFGTVTLRSALWARDPCA